jgi:hypothetical protein
LIEHHIATGQLGRGVTEHAPMDSSQPRTEKVGRNWAGKNVVRTIIQKNLLALFRACAQKHE